MPDVDNVDFRDSSLFRDMDGPAYDNIMHVMVHLAVCHTILVMKDENGVMKYNASSPDELALTNGAKYCGFNYLGVDDSGFVVVRHRM